ncbi:hypothetical protein HYC85_012079 [Camellia sinensis]|uniref:Uncharacterized protein n=1 Tax=Camellia sinensis TaxID=4442 RepID=A0A7J7HE62_CAMSI|nr:hypothetical protein HYC85_012079 [Camellia sinensis]
MLKKIFRKKVEAHKIEFREQEPRDILEDMAMMVHDGQNPSSWPNSPRLVGPNLSQVQDWWVRIYRHQTGRIALSLERVRIHELRDLLGPGLERVWLRRRVRREVDLLFGVFLILGEVTSSDKVVREPVIFIPIALFAIYNLYALSEYLRIGLSTRAWWNNQRIWRLNTMIAWSFGVLSVLLKLLGLSDTVFEVTQKDQSTNVDDNNANAGRFTFDDSPSFVLGTTILLVNLTALAIGLLRFRLVGGDGNGSGIGEFICSMWVVLCFWAFLRGLFGKGKYGIPSSTIYKSGALALLFVQLCKWV